MHVPVEPYPQGVSAIVHTRNEARHIEDCLRTLQGWTDEIIVCDMESTDNTIDISRRVLGDNDELEKSPCIVRHPLISNFDRARNVSAMRARYRWVFYLDADERVPPGLGPALRNLISNECDSFEAMLIPFRHHFAGHWMKCLYPGYTAPRLLKNGRFHFNARLHSGAEVDGRVGRFPADNPDLALVHYSYDSLSHYLDKLNRYTDGEAANMHRDGKPFHWQSAISHFVHDFQDYYRMGSAERDGVHGFIYSFLSAFYRFEQHAKLYEKRFNEGRLVPEELSVPQSVEEMLEYALSVARSKPLPGVPEIPVAQHAGTRGSENGFHQLSANVVWSGPLADPSGYGEESRELLLALNEALLSGQSVGGPKICDPDDFTCQVQTVVHIMASICTPDRTLCDAIGAPQKVARPDYDKGKQMQDCMLKFGASPAQLQTIKCPATIPSSCLCKDADVYRKHPYRCPPAKRAQI